LYTTLIILGILPMLVSVAALAGSIYALVHRPSVLQIAGVVVVAPSLSWSLLVIYEMARGAWPTLIPYFIIGGILPVVAVQLWRALRRPPHRRGFAVQAVESERDIPE
jgi:4-amino-4-deoxy-L-arabinose transferase-like glycosyltransferase